MAPQRQTLADRERRLSDGRCPIHGIGMVQVGLQGALFLAACPRKGCCVQGTSEAVPGAVTLLQEYRHLLV